MGADRVMFSVDWPFEAVEEGCAWFDKAEISEADRAKIGRDNAIKLFKLKRRSGSDSASTAFSFHTMPLPGRSGTTAWPSTITSGSCNSTSAQSTYSR